jgi:hypothetical protein
MNDSTGIISFRRGYEAKWQYWKVHFQLLMKRLSTRCCGLPFKVLWFRSAGPFSRTLSISQHLPQLTEIADLQSEASVDCQTYHRFLRWLIFSPERRISQFRPYQISWIDCTVTSRFGTNFPFSKMIWENSIDNQTVTY